MKHDYDFLPLTEEPGTNTSLKSEASPVQPPQQVVQNILDFARCCQHITTQKVKLRICLN